MHFIISALGSLFNFVCLVIWLILVVYAVLDLLRNRRFSQTVKLLWIVVIFVAPFFGSLLYLLWGRNQRY